MTPTSRAATGWLVLGLVAVASYAAQRLWAASAPVTQHDASLVATEHIPYYWRCGVSLFHGVIAGVLTAWAARESERAWLLRAGPWLVLAVVLPSAIAMLVVP